MDFSCKTNTTIPFLLYVVQFSFDNLQVYSFMWLYFALPLRTKQSRTKGSQFLWIYTSQAFTTKVFPRKKHISTHIGCRDGSRVARINWRPFGDVTSGVQCHNVIIAENSCHKMYVEFVNVQKMFKIKIPSAHYFGYKIFTK